MLRCASPKFLCRLLRDPGTGIGLPGIIFPPSAKPEYTGPLLSASLRHPCQKNLRTDLMRDQKGIQGDLIQCNLILFCRRLSVKRHGIGLLRPFFGKFRQLYIPVSQHFITECTYRRKKNRILHCIVALQQRCLFR